MPEPRARFEAIYDSSYRAIWAYCARRLPGHQVDDAVAEVFAVVWRRIDKVPHGDGELPWLYAVAFRVVSQQRRTDRRRSSLAERLRGLGSSPPLAVEPQVVEHMEIRLVRTAAERLSMNDQEILRLSLWEELSHAEVADVLGVSAETARQRLHRAKVRLARQYARLEQKSGSSQRGAS